MTDGHKAPTCARHAVPGSSAVRASASASMSVAPSAANRAATVLLPLPILPVTPTTSITQSGLQGRQTSCREKPRKDRIHASGLTYFTGFEVEIALAGIPERTSRREIERPGHGVGAALPVGEHLAG